MVEIKNCPICGQEKQELYKQVEDHSTSKEIFNIVRCLGCGFLFTSPRPSDQEIGKYYKSDKYISHTNQKTGLFGIAYQALRDRALSKKLGWINKHNQNAGNLLDYGCGTGEFLNHCQKNGWQVKGLEIAEGPRIQAKENYHLNVAEPAELENINPDTFDVITLWHVLEHVSDLRGLLEKLVLRLKPGGKLVLALPNPESYDAEYYQEQWAAWDVPIHFYHFRKQDVKTLADQYNLDLQETINMPYDAYYVSLLSEEYKTGRKNWINATLIGLRSNLKAKEENASSLTYILRKR